MPYVIPLDPIPNQTFRCSIPVDDGNIDLEITLRYNVIANYWSMSCANAETQEVYFTNLPLLSGYNKMTNLACQLGYKSIGSICIIPLDELEPTESAPDDTNLGDKYVLVWTDNNVID